MTETPADDLLILPPVLDLAAAPELLVNLQQRLAKPTGLRVDASFGEAADVRAWLAAAAQQRGWPALPLSEAA